MNGIFRCEIENGDEISVISCKVTGAEKIAADENGNVFVWKINIGKGTLYFGTFSDYSCPEGKMMVLKYVLNIMGEGSADVICTNPNISFTQRIKENGKKVLDVLNMCSNSKSAEEYELKFKDGASFTGSIMPCEIKSLEF